MKIALISPKGVKMGRPESMDKTSRIYQELANIQSLQELMSCPNSPLLTIAALAADYFDEIDYIDEEVEEIDWEAHYDTNWPGGFGRGACIPFAVGCIPPICRVRRLNISIRFL